MRTTRFSLLLGATVGVVGFAAPSAAQSSAAVIGRFTGTWKEDVTKRKVGSEADLHFQFNAKRELEEVRGPEARPIFQTIVFDGKPHDVGGKNRIAWKQIDPSTFERVLSDGQTGRTLTTRRIHLSADGKTLTERTERKATDVRTSVETVVYRRTSEGPQGLAGRWKATSFKTNTPTILTFAPAGTNGLRFSDSDSGATYVVMLDDKPVPVVGPAVIQGIMTSAKAVDDRTIIFTESRDSVTIQKIVRTVSADGRTLTATATPVVPNGSPEPSISAYVKQ